MPNRFKQSIERLETVNKANEPTPPPKTTINSSDFLGDIQTKSRQGRDTTFYLSHEVIQAITQLSQQRQISKSKIVDKALRQVLFN